MRLAIDPNSKGREPVQGQRRRAQLELAVAIVGAGAVITWAVMSTGSTGDYVTSAPVAGDNPGPAIAALAHGDLAAAAALQPLMGLTSLLLRVPAAATCASNLLTYRLGALLCLAPAALFAAWLALRGQRSRPLGATGDRSRPPAAAAVLAAVAILAAPTTRDAIGSGHPEEVLAAVLASSAALLAARGRGSLAGVLLGLAIAAKQWAVIAVVPVFAAMPRARVRTVVIAAATAAAMILPLALLNSAAFARAAHAVGNNHLTNAFSAWWPLGSSLPPHPGLALAPVRMLPLGLTRSVASFLPIALALAASALLVLRSHRPLRADRALALLALLALVRCLVDPLPLEYYFVSLVIALAGFEIVARHRLPLLTGVSIAAASVSFSPGLPISSAALSALSLLGWSALAAYLAATVAGVAGPRRFAGRPQIVRRLERLSRQLTVPPMHDQLLARDGADRRARDDR
jgi:hypothetical protein